MMLMRPRASIVAGRMRRRLLIALGIVSVVFGVAAPSALAGPGFINSIWGPIKFAPGEAGCPGPLRCSAIPVYKELGVEMFQYQLQWNQIAPTPPANPRDPNDPAYQWQPEFQFLVDEAAANGIAVSFLIKGSPPWANGGQSRNHAPSPGAFADFAYAASRRYPSVHHWQIWGEPTRANNWLPQKRKGARKYARMLDAAYGALNQADPANIVIGGMTFFGGFTRPATWIRFLRLPNGKPPHMDWYGHNPFERRLPNIRKKPIGSYRGLSDVDTLWREVKRAYQRRTRSGRLRFVYKRGRPKKLWLSEWSVQTDHDSYVFDYHVSRSRQVTYLNRAFALARRAPYVQGMGWYQLIDYPPAPRNPTWGLMEYDGDRKPVFNAYKALP
jgi:hypothetical protein